MKINKLDHLETLIGSLNKLLANARNKGIINNKELSLLHLIYKLVNNKCFNDLDEIKSRKLITLYSKLLRKYSFLCKPEIQLSNNTYINTNSKNVFTNNNKNTAPTINNPATIYSSDTVLKNAGDIYNFNNNSFINNYFDKENNTPNNVIILSLPTNGKLFFNNTEVELGFIFKINQSNLLSYERYNENAYLDNFNFKVSDNNFNELYSNIATQNFNITTSITIPTYFGLNKTISNLSCNNNTYLDFNFNTAPAKNNYTISGFDSNFYILTGYTGIPYKTLVITNFEVTSDNIPINNTAKLYYNGNEIINFPLYIDIENKPINYDTGLTIGYQLLAPCISQDNNYKAQISFKIIDTNNNEGGIRNTNLINYYINV